jgi:hypothetical protein
MSAIRSGKDATDNLEKQFDVHVCKQSDAN